MSFRRPSCFFRRPVHESYAYATGIILCDDEAFALSTLPVADIPARRLSPLGYRLCIRGDSEFADGGPTTDSSGPVRLSLRFALVGWGPKARGPAIRSVSCRGKNEHFRFFLLPSDLPSCTLTLSYTYSPMGSAHGGAGKRECPATWLGSSGFSRVRHRRLRRLPPSTCARCRGASGIHSPLGVSRATPSRPLSSPTGSCVVRPFVRPRRPVT